MKQTTGKNTGSHICGIYADKEEYGKGSEYEKMFNKRSNQQKSNRKEIIKTFQEEKEEDN